MKGLLIGNRLIETPLRTIIERLQKDTNYEYIRDIKNTGLNLMITCPFHANHKEKHPSCGVCLDDTSSNYGVFHCFTCGEKGFITDLVSQCLEISLQEAEDWLKNNFSNTFIETEYYLPEINLNNIQQVTYLDESVLDRYRYFHKYMFHRKLTEQIIRKFDVGYDPQQNCITFPLRDVKGNLLGISCRSVETKKFYIPSNIEKPVYLLDTLIKEGYNSCIVCESQIDALTAWSFGYAAIALIGTGTKKQYETLNKCPIRHYVLMFDGDLAGKHGELRFIKNIRKDVLVDCIHLPTNKDINDLQKDEFENLLKKYGQLDNLKVKIV